MSEHYGELLDPTTTLAEVALRAHEDAKRELAEYEQTLTKALGAKPGPKTVAEMEVEVATAETVGILGIAINTWTRGSLPTSRGYSWLCWWSEIPGNDTAILIYFPSQFGLCALIDCHAHQHLRRLSSLADLGEILAWRPIDCWRETLTRREDRKTIRLAISI